jgi:uncharacterized protein Usg
MKTIDDVVYKCCLELSGLKYIYPATIEGAIKAVCYQHDRILTIEEHQVVKEKIIEGLNKIINKDA